MSISIVMAVSRNGVIGKDGKLPWHLPIDMARFKKLTTGHTVVMGRRTWESLPERFRPLPSRRNIVISTTLGPEVFDGLFSSDLACEVAKSLDLALSEIPEDEEVFIIGGAQLYEAALPLADRMYITRVEAEVEGDTLIPAIGFKRKWNLISRDHRDADEENEYPISFEIWERRANPRAESSTHVNLVNARVDEQKRKMEELQSKGQCHLCPEGLVLHDEPIEFDGKYWFVTRNDYPYEGVYRYPTGDDRKWAHILVIYWQHAVRLADIDPVAGEEFIQALQYVEQTYGLWTGAVNMRFGDMRYNGATLDHLHAHIVMGDVENSNHKPIRFKISDYPDRKS